MSIENMDRRRSRREGQQDPKNPQRPGLNQDDEKLQEGDYRNVETSGNKLKDFNDGSNTSPEDELSRDKEHSKKDKV